MKKVLMVLALLLLNIGVQAQTFEWAKQFGNNPWSDDFPYTLQSDSSNNIYLSAAFSAYTQLDSFSSNGLASFYSTIVKMDSNGNVKWTRQFAPSGPGFSFSYFSSSTNRSGITDFCDSRDNFYFEEDSLIYFDTAFVTTGLLENGYVVGQLNHDGTLAWSNVFDGTSLPIAAIYLTDDNKTFLLRRNDSSNLFLVEMNSTGKIVKQREIGTDVLIYSLKAIRGTHDGNLILTFEGGDSTTTSSVCGDIYNKPHNFIVKVDTSGNCIWKTTAFGRVSDMDIDDSDNVYVTDDSSIYAAESDQLIKFDKNGNLLWTKLFDNASVHVAASGNSSVIYGSFYGTLDFGNGISLTSGNWFSGGAYMAKFGKNGNALWALQPGSPVCTENNAAVEFISAYSKSSGLYAAGSYSLNNVSFGNYVLSQPGQCGWSNVFLTKIEDAVITSAISPSGFTRNILNIYPNPVIGYATVESLYNIQSITVSDVLGNIVVYAKNFNGNSVTTLDLTFLQKGIYFVKTLTDRGLCVQKILKS